MPKRTSFNIDALLNEDSNDSGTPVLERMDLLPSEDPERPGEVLQRPSTPAKKSRTVSPEPASDHPYYSVIGESRSTNRRYKGARYVATYTFEKLEESKDPESVLREVIDSDMNEVLRTAREANIIADIIIVVISSEVLDWDIQYHIQQIDEDSVNQVLHEFTRIDQSNSKKDERGSLYGAPFRVDMLAFSRSQLRATVGTKKPEGPKKHRYGRKHRGGSRLRPVVHNIDPNALILINNEDNLCLFRAIVILVARATIEHPQQFQTYRFDEARILSDVHALMDALNISRDEPNYAIEDYGEQIQFYYDQPNKFPGKFKIFCFKTIGLYKPFYTTEVDRFETPISLYYHDNHYDAIKTISTFFKRQYYCFTCHTTFSNKKSHDMGCKSRCVNCCNVDYSKCPCLPDNNAPRKCDGCKKIFNNQSCFDEHLRNRACDTSKGPCLPDNNAPRKCDGCKKIFNNQSCFDEHLRNRACDTSKECENCGVIYAVEPTTRAGGHKCGTTYCQKCNCYRPIKHRCSIPPISKPKEKDYRIVIFDFECTQDYQPNPDLLRFEHQVNFISATVVCTRCIAAKSWKEPLTAECDICGNNRTHAWAIADFKETAFDYKNISPNPLCAFVKWLLYDFNKGPQKKFETVALSHFGGRYDMILVFGEIFRLGGLCPSIIRQGNKLYEIEAKKKGIITTTYFRDTFNIMPVGLGKLIDCFGLTEVEDKQFFPHLFNKVSNLNVELPKLPPARDYLFAGMKIQKRNEFMKWYFANRTKPFVLREQLAAYCSSDVKILLHAVVEMQNLYKELTGLDIFLSKTIASGVMKHFRVNHLEPGALAIVPENGYEPHFKQSKLAINFLKWYQHKHNIKLQTSESVEGEKYCGDYLLDGYAKGQNGQRDLAIEINGCYWHACKKHYPDNQMIVAKGETAGLVRQGNAKKEAFIRQDHDLKVFWECEINDMLKSEPGMKEYFENTFDSSAIKLRDSFFGGRTGPERLHAEADPGKTKIAYLDFQSLYPSRQYVEDYPLGHPKVTVLNEYKHWTSSQENPYCGIIKCLVEPPRTGVPVLPLRLENDTRLLFPLCHKCAKENKVGKKDPNYNCTHFGLNRCFVTTTTHLELNAALDAGYIVHKIFRVYTWDKWSSFVFKDYIKEFLQIKIESSDWPKQCKDPAFPDNLPLPDQNDNTLTLEQQENLQRIKRERENFLEETRDRYNIELRPEKIRWNPGLRYIAKLALNSLWGRFALRNNLSKTKIIDSPEELIDHLDNYRINVVSIDQLNEDALMIAYCEKAEYIEEHPSSNIVVSIFTTSAARVHLLKVLQKVHGDPESEILYYDTDSIIYKYPDCRDYFRHIVDPLHKDIGKHLGELTDEYPNHEIQEFISLACKSYMLRIRKMDAPDAEDEYVMRSKGITFDQNTCRKLTFDEYKRRVLNFGEEDPPLPLNYQMLRPNKLGKIVTVPMTKRFRGIITKGIVLGDNRVVPFGYSNPNDPEIDKLHKKGMERTRLRFQRLGEQRERTRINLINQTINQ